MSLITSFFSVTIYQPLFNILIGIYNIIPDLGVGIILLTVIIRLLLLPLSKKSIESQKQMQEIQPEIKKIQAKYKDNKQKQGEEIMKFYREKKVNPMGGCLPLIIQLIILIALYRVFMAVIDYDSANNLLYGFIDNPMEIKTLSFGFLDMATTGKSNLLLALVTAGLQYWQGKMMIQKNLSNKPIEKDKAKDTKEPEFAEVMQKQMLYMGPILTLVIGLTFPAGLLVYWFVTTLFMVGQQYWILNKEKNQKTT
jgi:YidC/Oxa1 family membrane protein insertase